MTLLLKLALVAGALAAAAVSRRSVHHDRSPWASVRVETVAGFVVLALTAVLAMTPPPTDSPPSADPSDRLEQQRDSTTVEMDLGEGRTARLHVDGLRTGGSDLHLELTDAAGEPLRVNRVELKLTLPAEGLGPFSVPLADDPVGRLGSFSFALPGTWTATLAVEDRELAGIVTTGEVTIAE